MYQLNVKVLDNTLLNYYSNLSQGKYYIELKNNEEQIIEPFKIGIINFKIQCEMINIETNKLVNYYLVPCLSISDTSFQMATSIGIIDAEYRGEIKARIRNTQHQYSEILKIGQYFQIIAPDLKPIRINIVQELTVYEHVL